MQRWMPWKLTILASLAGVVTALAGTGFAARDFGQLQEDQVRAHSRQEFGIVSPLDQSSSASLSAAQAQADPTALVTLAGNLSARVVSSGTAGRSIDMMALWPDDQNPTHLIACNEEGTSQPGLQRIGIASGAVETIVTGTTSCDGVRRTPWGTILFSEEAGGGPNGGRV